MEAFPLSSETRGESNINGWGAIHQQIYTSSASYPNESTRNTKTRLSTFAKILEEDPTTPWFILVHCISNYPKELGFSVLLATMRYFIPYADDSTRKMVMNKIFNAIDEYYEHIPMPHYFETYHPSKASPDNVVGGALTLSWERSIYHHRHRRRNQYNERGAEISAGGASRGPVALDGTYIFKMIFERYPKSVLYKSNGLSPIDEACCSFDGRIYRNHTNYDPSFLNNNISLFKMFVEQHLKSDPSGKSGLYDDKGYIDNRTPLESLLKTKENIVPVLEYLHEYANPVPLLSPHDIIANNLLHKAVSDSSIETIKFFISLCPHAILMKDEQGKSPFYYFYFSHIIAFDSLRISEEKREILKLMIVTGIMYETSSRCTSTVEEQNEQEGLVVEQTKSFPHCYTEDEVEETALLGGLLSYKAEDCFLSSFMDDSGCNSVEAMKFIKSCISDFTYCEAPILHAAIGKVKYEHLKCIIDTFGASKRNFQGNLPLQYALGKGLPWSSGIREIVAAYPKALTERHIDTGLPPFAQAATPRTDRDVVGDCGEEMGTNQLDTIFNLLLQTDTSEMFLLGNSNNQISSSSSAPSESNLLAIIKEEEEEEEQHDPEQPRRRTLKRRQPIPIVVDTEGDVHYVNFESTLQKRTKNNPC